MVEHMWTNIHLWHFFPFFLRTVQKQLQSIARTARYRNGRDGENCDQHTELEHIRGSVEESHRKRFVARVLVIVVDNGRQDDGAVVVRSAIGGVVGCRSLRRQQQ